MSADKKASPASGKESFEAEMAKLEQLVDSLESGKVSLDDDIGKYFPDMPRYERPITVRHLLTHTSGLGYGFTSATVRDFKPKPGDSFEVGPLLFDPGTQWLYGTSTDWVGRLVEAVSGEDLETYFRSHITGPLGMADTAFNLPAAAQARLVNNWQRSPAGDLSERPRQATQPVTAFNGGGGLSSTATDYMTFVRMILNDGQDRAGTGKTTRILSAASVAEMSRNQMGAVSARALKSAQPTQSADFSFIRDGRDKWGLGFLISTAPPPGRRSAGSLSWGGINNTYFWIDRTKGIGGVIMMQFLPFADPHALALYDAFEAAVYAGR